MSDEEAALVARIAAKHFRGWDHPRRHVPCIWWDGHTWNMSVRDPYNNHHTRCADSWADIQSFGKTWALINTAHNLLPTKRETVGKP